MRARPRRQLVTLLAVATAVVFGCHATKELPPTAADLSAACAHMHLALPSDARVLHWHREAGLDEYVRLKVEMPRARWAAFVAGSPLRGHAFEHERAGYLGSDEGPWDPHRDPSLRAVQVLLPDNSALNAGVSGLDSPGQHTFTVYLAWNST